MFVVAGRLWEWDYGTILIVCCITLIVDPVEDRVGSILISDDSGPPGAGWGQGFDLKIKLYNFKISIVDKDDYLGSLSGFKKPLHRKRGKL